MAGTASFLGEIVQGTAVAVAADADGPLCGVLLTGASGAGKSDLALRLIDTCRWRRTRMVADDAVLVGEAGGLLVARCAPRIEGKIEIRSVGIVPVASCPSVALRLVVDLDKDVSRLPDPQTDRIIAGSRIALPVLPFDPFQQSAPAKLRYAVRAQLARQFEAARREALVPGERQGSS